MQFEAGDVIEADETAVSLALADLMDAVDVCAEEHGEGVTLLAVVNLYRIHRDVLGIIEHDRNLN